MKITRERSFITAAFIGVIALTQTAAAQSLSAAAQGSSKDLFNFSADSTTLGSELEPNWKLLPYGNSLLNAQEQAAANAIADAANTPPVTNIVANNAIASIGILDEKAQSAKIDKEEDNNWRFNITIVIWVVGIHGTETVDGHDSDTSLAFDDVVRHLDGGGMAYLEARNDNFGFYVQPNYVELSSEGSSGSLKSEDKLKAWLVGAGAFYQIGEWGKERPLTLDVTAGFRYWNLNNHLTLRGAGGIVNYSGSSTLEVLDAVVGLRAKKYFTQNLSVTLQADVGGFGIFDTSSDYTWQGVGTVTYDFSELFSIFAGYRAIAVSKEVGSGTSRQGATVILDGIIFGVSFNF